ncbi:hypothetical protein AYI69_g10922 [Smittium culicis]|uniref:Uncharacterized protein n=1 Tax=Smittium culicis TaxID=133412 RepID=A0A1R1X2G1_9FUNG|nr:hypothetical protein AYI69_g10922 [Smittium culicis]
MKTRYNCNQEHVFKPVEKVLVKIHGADNSDICKKEGHRSWNCSEGRAQNDFNDAQKEDKNVGQNAVWCIELEEILPEGLKFKDQEINKVDKMTMEELSEEHRNREKIQKVLDTAV